MVSRQALPQRRRAVSRIRAALDWFLLVSFRYLLPLYALVVGHANTEAATNIIAWCILYRVMENGHREP